METTNSANNKLPLSDDPTSDDFTKKESAFIEADSNEMPLTPRPPAFEEKPI